VKRYSEQIVNISGFIWDIKTGSLRSGTGNNLKVNFGVSPGEILEFRRPAYIFPIVYHPRLASCDIFRNGSAMRCCQTKWNNTVSSDVGLSARDPPLDECPRTLEVHCAVWGRHVG
jgi:hypothetical protein